MCDDDCFEPIGDIVARLVDGLRASGVERALEAPASALATDNGLSPYVRFSPRDKGAAGTGNPAHLLGCTIVQIGKRPGIRAGKFGQATDRLAAGGSAVNLAIRERRTAPNGIAAASS